MKIYTAFDLNPDRPVLHCGPGLTRQSDLDDSNINIIMSRFAKTGVLPTSSRPGGQFFDTSDMDFQTLQDKVLEARTIFESAPYAENFDSIEEFLEFVDLVESGNQEAIELANDLGMLKIKPDNQTAPRSVAQQSDQPRSDSGNSRSGSITEQSAAPSVSAQSST